MMYVIYDQFHWGRKDHIEVLASDWNDALAKNQFYKQAFPRESFGMLPLEAFLRKAASIRSNHCQFCK